MVSAIKQWLESKVEDIVLLGLITLVAIIAVSIIVFAAHRDLENRCTRYSEEYNIRTEMVGSFFDSGEYCVVHMTDGTKVRLDDFQIASVKQPLTAR